MGRMGEGSAGYKHTRVELIIVQVSGVRRPGVVPLHRM